MNTQITQNEKDLLEEFAFCEMNCLNGAPLERANVSSDLDTYVWLDDRKVGNLNTTQKKGVLGSLVKKDLVSVCKDEDGDYLGFTDSGFALVKKLFG